MSKCKVISALCLVAILAQPVKPENVLEAFVRGKLNNYSTWAKANNFDPSPALTGPTRIKASGFDVALDCDLSNHIVQGHSEGINITWIEADLNRIYMSFVIPENLKFSGDYVANGTLGWWDTTPFDGQGSWHITLPEFVYDDISFDYVVNCAGHVEITDYDFYGIAMPYSRKGEVEFETLWDDGEAAEYNESIKDALYDGYREYLRDTPNHPLKQTILQYFQEIFATEKWEEIILPTLRSDSIHASKFIRTSRRAPLRTAEENILEKFVREKVTDYPTWIKDNSKDPSEPVPGPTPLDISSFWVKLDCTLSNHFIQGHSQDIEITSIKADLNEVYVSFKILGNTSFSGSYKANGTYETYPDDIPLEGEGSWYINFTNLAVEDFYFNYSVSPDDKVIITGRDFDDIYWPWTTPEVYFEGLYDELEDDYDQRQVTGALNNGFQVYLEKDTEHPLKKMYLQYFEEIFQNTKWTEMVVPNQETCINVTTTTPRPTTTTTPRPTTTTGPTTTPPSTTTPPGMYLETFVRNKLAEYPSWMTAKSLDPSPNVNGPTYIEAYSSFTVDMDCFLSNYIVENHSNGLNVTSVKATQDSVSMSLTLEENVTFSGSYIANGTIGLYDIPISGDGAWNITYPVLTFRNLYFNFTILSSGYALITHYSFDGPNLPGGWNPPNGEVYFENLWEAEEYENYRDSIKNALYDGLGKYLKEKEDHPLKQTYIQYFNEVFASTPWAEIIDPPATTPENTPTTPGESETSGIPSPSTSNGETSSSSTASNTEPTVSSPTSEEGNPPTRPSSTSPPATDGAVQVSKPVAIVILITIIATCLH